MFLGEGRGALLCSNLHFSFLFYFTLAVIDCFLAVRGCFDAYLIQHINNFISSLLRQDNRRTSNLRTPSEVKEHQEKRGTCPVQPLTFKH